MLNDYLKSNILTRRVILPTGGGLPPLPPDTVIFKGVLGESVLRGSVVYRFTDGKFYNADCSNPDKLPAIGVTKEGGSNGDEVEIVLIGVVEDVNKEDNLQEGDIVYVSTQGRITPYPPESNNYHQMVGVALNSSDIVVNINLECLLV